MINLEVIVHFEIVALLWASTVYYSVSLDLF